MTYLEFEKEKGIIMGRCLRRIYKEKVRINARFLPGKITPEQFWVLAVKNNQYIQEVTCTK